MIYDCLKLEGFSYRHFKLNGGSKIDKNKSEVEQIFNLQNILIAIAMFQ